MDSMNVYKHGRSWWVRFSWQERTRKIRAARNRREAEAFGRQIALLVDTARAGLSLSDEQLRWFSSIDKKRAGKLVEMQLVMPAQMVAQETIEEQMDRWQASLLNRGRSESEANMRVKRAKAIAKACRWQSFRDVDAEQVLACIDQWRRDGKVPGYNRKSTVSERTLGHYLAAVKQFSRWMMTSNYSPRDPLAALSVERRQARSSAVASNMAKRRPLTEQEQRQLLETTLRGRELSRNMPREQRHLLYRVALETGLRASAIRRLRSCDIDASGWLLARCGGAKNKKTTPKPVRPGLLSALLDHAATRPPESPLFDAPQACDWARMLREDAEAAGIDTEGVDFHCLRHTFGTTLARQGVHPKTLMSLMDHSDINMTMRMYTHSMPGDEATAMGLLPDFDAAHDAPQNAPQGVLKHGA